jgi:hypothetical protein
MHVWSRAPLSSHLRVHRRWLPRITKLLLQSAALQYWRILSQIDTAVRSEDHVEVMGLNAAGAALKSVFSDGSLTEAVWLTHLLLWALPWAHTASLIIKYLHATCPLVPSQPVCDF